MTAVHRPLSAWISHLSPDGTLGPVNDGDDRIDARELAYFADDWQRTAVPLSQGGHALGLSHGDGRTVVELTDYGSPIPVTTATVTTIAEVERHWPMVDRKLADELRSLADASFTLRYWLLERLADEGDPPDEAFAILPWELLDRAARAVTDGLRPDGELGELVETRHWLTPALRGLTGPLEQLDHGLRVGDGRIARQGASTLLARMRDIGFDRVPATTRHELGLLVDQLAVTDPMYRHMCRLASAALAKMASPPNQIRTELHSTMEAAAGTDDVREHQEVLGDDLQQLRVVETQAGRVRLTAQIAAASTAYTVLTRRLGAFLPVRLTPRDGRPPLRYWIVLHPESNHLIGSITLPLPHGRSELAADDAPVDADELNSVDPTELLASLDASTHPTARSWLRLAASLPADHPVRMAAETYEESS